MKNILFITTMYPPIQSIATNRMVSFVKYIDKQKYQIFVITIETEEKTTEDFEGVTVYRLTDNSFLRRFGLTKKMSRVARLAKVGYNALVVGSLPQMEMYDWRRKAEEVADILMQNEGIDLVFSSFGPASAHQVAMWFKKKYPHVPWIADMRDEFISPDERNPLRLLFLQRLQLQILSLADAVTSVSEPILNDFRNACPRPNVTFREVRNGYDFEVDTTDFRSREEFIIVYTGSFYRKIGPGNFLKALERFVSGEKYKKVKVCIFGVPKPFSIPKNIQNILVHHGMVNHQKAIQEMRHANLLLLVLPNTARKGVYSGKLFEYLASTTPILALVPKNDVAAQLIRDCNAGYIADNDSIEEIEQALLQAYEDWLEGRKLDINLDLIKRHHRREQTKILESLMDELTNKERK